MPQLSKRMGVRLEARRKREAEAARIAAIKQAEAEQWEAVQVTRCSRARRKRLHCLLCIACCASQIALQGRVIARLAGVLPHCRSALARMLARSSTSWSSGKSCRTALARTLARSLTSWSSGKSTARTSWCGRCRRLRRRRRRLLLSSSRRSQLLLLLQLPCQPPPSAALQPACLPAGISHLQQTLQVPTLDMLTSGMCDILCGQVLLEGGAFAV